MELLADEHPDSIDFGELAVVMTDDAPSGSVEIVDWPATYHKSAAAVSFTDGHAESHVWQNRNTKPPTIGVYIDVRPCRPLVSPGNVDMIYLSKLSTV